MDVLKKRYQKDPDMASREIADEVILVPIKRKLVDVNSIFLLQDDVSTRIWDLLDGQRTVKEITDKICTEFTVQEEKAQKDIKEFFSQMEKIGGIIREVI